MLVSEAITMAGYASSVGSTRTTLPRRRLLAGVLVALAVAIAAAALLGPVGVGLLVYRTSPTSLNQLIGSDAAALFVVTPLVLVAAVLARRGHGAAPLLAAGIGGYAIYTYAQVIIGQEYLRLPGNVERFFPLLLLVFVLAEAAVVLAWRGIPDHLPSPSPRLQRVLGVVLILVAVFLVFGLHLRTMLVAWQEPMSMTEYASSPTPFWMVKLMDLGIIVPVALAIGVGVLRHAAWALRVALPLVTGYTCLAASVAAMSLVMIVNGDPDASVGLAVGFVAFAAAFATLTVMLFRPLFGSAGPVADVRVGAAATPTAVGSCSRPSG